MDFFEQQETAKRRIRWLTVYFGLAVAADGVIQPKEAELLRAIADSLGCLIPPLLMEPAPAMP